MIFSIQIYGTFFLPYVNRHAYSSDTKIGWTMISGEYVFIGVDDALLQKMWPRSPPTFNADMAE